MKKPASKDELTKNERRFPTHGELSAPSTRTPCDFFAVYIRANGRGVYEQIRVRCIAIASFARLGLVRVLDEVPDRGREYWVPPTDLRLLTSRGVP